MNTQQSRTPHKYLWMYVCMWLWVWIDLIYGFEWHVVVCLAVPCAFDIVYFIFFFCVSSSSTSIFSCAYELGCILTVYWEWNCIYALCDNAYMYVLILSLWRNNALFFLKKRERKRQHGTQNRVYTVEVNNFVSLSETWQTYKFLFFSHSICILCVCGSMSSDGRLNKKRISITLLTKFDK